MFLDMRGSHEASDYLFAAGCGLIASLGVLGGCLLCWARGEPEVAFCFAAGGIVAWLLGGFGALRKYRELTRR